MNTFLRILLALLLAILPVLACVSGPNGGIGEWWSGHGPVIPHQQFPGDCALCHTTKNWQSLKSDFEYDHLAETGVELVGAHSEAQCLRCHNDRGPVQNFAAFGCGGCHEDRHEGRLGAECQDCHSEETWQPIGPIAEHGRTRFPLVGIHAAVTCDRCHPGIGSGVFDVLSPECVGCHQADLARATSPDHQSQGWVDNCERCHLPTNWAGAGFRHGGFRLTGAHAVADCESCHVGGQYSGLGDQCADCHMDSYNAASDPDHAGLGLPIACDRCHNSSQWQPAQFDHGWVSGSCVDCHLDEFLGTTDPDHVAKGYAQSCQDCHGTKAWRPAGFNHSGIKNGCVDCHLDEYLATTNPDHVAQGYAQSCQDCHGTNAWQPAGFDHGGISNGCVDCHADEYNSTSAPNHIVRGYPDTCQMCHSVNAWVPSNFGHSGVSSGCVDCHQREYDNTTDPNHSALNIPLTCENCHSTNAWRPAGFDHAGITNGCADCHTNDYNNTNDPNHAAAGFPMQCQICHGTNTWNGANFDHNFPIDSGDHKNFDCSDCHLTPGNYAAFSCIDCHEHRRSKMDDEHDKVSGYVWQSTACYACHPDGKD